MFGLITLFEAGLLFLNAIAVLHEERFLRKFGWADDQQIRVTSNKADSYFLKFSEQDFRIIYLMPTQKMKFHVFTNLAIFDKVG